MQYSFKSFQGEYPDDAACLKAVMVSQYGGTKITCPGCGVAEAQFHPMTARRGYACQECGHHIYPCANTIFHKSRTPLTHWFFAMYLMTSTRHGVAAKELERQIGCTYKTAWRMAHELRKLMATADSSSGPMTGHVEMDETFIGGKVRHHGVKAGLDNKAVVFGMLQRDGRVVAGPVLNRLKGTLEPIIKKNVARGTMISTDEHGAYRDLAGIGFNHGTVNHAKEEWVVGITHTNSIEGHWGQLKRSIKGTHIHVSHKHLWKYVSEFSYRRNNRGSHYGMFKKLVVSLSQPRLAET